MEERTEIWLRLFLYKILELVGIGIISIGAYWFGRFLNKILPGSIEVGWFGKWALGIIGILFISLIICLIVGWCLKNWEWAEEHTIEYRKKYRKK